MKKHLLFIPFLLLLLFITNGCKKTDNIKDNIPDEFTSCGIFRDTTNYSVIDPVYAPVTQAHVQLSFYGDNRYDIITTDSIGIKPFITRYSNVGSGTYKILNATQIQFTDEHVLTADFDWRLMLNGIYNYTYDSTAKKLIISRETFSYTFTDTCSDIIFPKLYADVTVIDAGVVAADGCDWQMQINDSTYYHPEYLAPEFKINNKRVRIYYSFTNENFYCGLLPMPYKIIRIYTIQSL